MPKTTASSSFFLLFERNKACFRRVSPFCHIRRQSIEFVSSRVPLGCLSAGRHPWPRLGAEAPLLQETWNPRSAPDWLEVPVGRETSLRGAATADTIPVEHVRARKARFQESAGPCRDGFGSES